MFSCVSFLQIEPGLGLPEEFYAWAIATFSIGEIVGAITTGLLANIIPFWYGVLICLSTHIVAFLVYGLATAGWMIILARFLGGMFVAMQTVISYTYLGVTYEQYLEALGEARKEEEGKTTRVKDTVFALFLIMCPAGTLFGPG